MRRADKAAVRALQRQAERERGRRVLARDGEEGGGGASSGSEGGDSDEDGGRGHGRRWKKRRREGGEPEEVRALLVGCGYPQPVLLPFPHHCLVPCHDPAYALYACDASSANRPSCAAALDSSGSLKAFGSSEQRHQISTLTIRHLVFPQVDLRTLDLEASVDVHGMAAAALRRLTAADVNLLKCLLAASLYPHVRICPIVATSHDFSCPCFTDSPENATLQGTTLLRCYMQDARAYCLWQQWRNQGPLMH